MRKHWLRHFRDDWTSRGIRNLVVEIYGGCCSWCESKELLEIDHIIPLWFLGTNTGGNLQLLCRSCHKEKTKKDRYKFGYKKSQNKVIDYVENLRLWWNDEIERPKIPRGIKLNNSRE